MILAVDIGGTFVKWGVADGYELVRQGKKETPKDSMDSLIKTIQGILNEQKEYPIEGLAVSYPGMTDPRTGIAVPIGSLEYLKGSRIEDELKKAFPMPVVMENDGRCAAIAEAKHGNLRGISRGYVIVIGTGLGGSFVLDGQVLTGSHGYAGQISLLMNGDVRSQGLGALLSTKLGMTGFVERGAKYLEMPQLNGEKLMELVEAGDPKAVGLLDEYMNLFSEKLFSLQMLLDPERFLIGGGISQNAVFMKRMQDKYEEIYQMFHLELPHAEILPCKFRNTAGMIGALSIFYETVQTGGKR